AQNQEHIGISWILSSGAFYLFAFLVMTTLITNTWVSLFVPKRLFERALMLREHARQVRRLFAANEIGVRFKETELIYIENGFVRVRWLMEMSKRLTLNTMIRVAYILANLAII